jgi:DNA polymerase III epsilon subunit-like protein
VSTRIDNYYINIDPSIEIPENIIELTGITREMCNGGVDIVIALTKFYDMYEKSDFIVAHNISFDSKMIMIEFERNIKRLQKPLSPPTSDHPITRNAKRKALIFQQTNIENKCENPYILFNPLYNKLNKKQMVCTMQSGRDIANIYSTYKSAKCNNCSVAGPDRTFKKTPKLIELYQKLYPEMSVPANLHNSLVDTRICLLCFLKINYTGVNDVIFDFLNMIE